MEAADGSTSRTAAPEKIVWVRRWRLESFRIVLSFSALAVATVLTIEPPAGWEVSLFRVINDLPRQAQWVLWPLQQAGMAMAVPVGGVILWFLVRHWRPPVTLVLGGIVLGWAAAKAIKEIVGRARPPALLADVQLGFDVSVGGIGYPSGHAVVAFALAVVLSPYLTRWLRWGLYGLAVVVAFSRVYVGAHMPLDVVGGAAFGVLVGSAVCLVSGIRADRARPEVLHSGAGANRAR